LDYLPIFLSIQGRPCLVVGGGEVAARKVSLLGKAGGRVTVLAPKLGHTLAQKAEEGTIEYRCKEFTEDELEGFVLVIAATNRPEVNQQVSIAAQRRSLPLNVVDNAELGSFIMPSIIDRSPVQIAVSTGGASPVLARLLRTRLETLIPAAYGRLGSLVESFRTQVKAAFGDIIERRAFWERVLQGPIAEMVFAGQEKAARQTLQEVLERDVLEHQEVGEVYLVGGGPGDPDLLTFRALRLMQQADVVLYDRLVAPPILELCRRDAEFMYVGKQRDRHTLPQEDINQLLVRLAKEGKRVLRLKGGDPFIFGRGGEEIDTLAQEGIPFQVVPGITAASGCAAYAGIPLTHRDYSQSCVFVTGHLKDGSMGLNWRMLVQPGQTVAIYMGVHGVEILCRELITHGVSATMPIALVEQGTTPQQRVLTGTLETLPELVKTTQIHPPTLIIVGEVVRLHEKLAWFEPAEAERETRTLPIL
jgi:uroporphyrin-III C-methyltransferase/precorrin-2 dehydrogenase/sirohydrochlorin ferrochelatase